MGEYDIVTNNDCDWFDTSDLTFNTGNSILDVVANVGVRLAIGAAAVVAGNALYYGGKKGFEAIGAKIEEQQAALAAQQAALAAQQQAALAQQQVVVEQTAVPQQQPQAAPMGAPLQQGQPQQAAPMGSPVQVFNPDGTPAN